MPDITRDQNFLRRITAADNTHTYAISVSVAAALLKLETRYLASSWSIIKDEQGQILDQQEKTDEKQWEEIQALLPNNQSIEDAYQDLRNDMLSQLSKLIQLYPQDIRLSQLTSVINTAFPETMECRVFQWEIVDSIFNKDDNSEIRKIFPIHYVFALVWIALNDHAQFMGNYTGTPEEQLQQAKDDLGARLLTFFNSLHFNMYNGVCSHGARNAMVLCLNKIHVDVDLIEDLQSSISYYSAELLSQEADALLATLLHNSDTSPALLDVQHALIEWIESDIGDFSTFKTLIETNKSNKLESQITDFLADHGINPDAAETQQLWQKALQFMPFNLNIQHSSITNQTVKKVNALINEKEQMSLGLLPLDNNDYKKKLDTLVDWLKSDKCFFLSNLKDQEHIINTSQLLHIFRFLNEHRILLLITGMKSEDEIAEYNTQIIAALNTEVPDLNLEVLTSTINNAVEQAKQTGQFTFVENFFALWFIDNEDPEEQIDVQTNLYASLLDPQISQSLIMTDEQINILLDKNKDVLTTEIAVSPFEINRIFLHALLINPEQWTDKFAETLHVFLEFVQEKIKTEGVGNILKNTSYPPQLLHQLSYYQMLYQHKTEQLTVDTMERPQEMILLPTQVTTALEWESMKQFIPFEQKYILEGSIIERILAAPAQILSVADWQATRSLLYFHQERYLETITTRFLDSYQLRSAAEWVIISPRLTLEQKKTFLQDSNRRASFFSMLVDYDGKFTQIRQSIPVVLQPIPIDYEWEFIKKTIEHCKKTLSAKKSIKVLFNSFDIESVIYRHFLKAPQKEQLELIDHLFEVTSDGKTRVILPEFLYGFLRPADLPVSIPSNKNKISLQEDFLKLLSQNRLYSLLSDDESFLKEIITILYPENIPYIIKALTENQLPNVLLNSEFLCECLVHLCPEEKPKSSFKYRLFEGALDSHDKLALKRYNLSCRNQQEFLALISKEQLTTVIQDVDSLISLLCALQPDNRASLIKKLDDSTLKNLIKNSTQLKHILILLPSSNYSRLINQWGNEFVQQRVTNIEEFLMILHHIPDFGLLLALGDEYIQSVIFSAQDEQEYLQKALMFYKNSSATIHADDEVHCIQLLGGVATLQKAVTEPNTLINVFASIKKTISSNRMTQLIDIFNSLEEEYLSQLIQQPDTIEQFMDVFCDENEHVWPFIKKLNADVLKAYACNYKQLMTLISFLPTPSIEEQPRLNPPELEAEDDTIEPNDEDYYSDGSYRSENSQGSFIGLASQSWMREEDLNEAMDDSNRLQLYLNNKSPSQLHYLIQRLGKEYIQEIIQQAPEKINQIILNKLDELAPDQMEHISPRP